MVHEYQQIYAWLVLIYHQLHFYFENLRESDLPAIINNLRNYYIKLSYIILSHSSNTWIYGSKKVNYLSIIQLLDNLSIFFLHIAYDKKFSFTISYEKFISNCLSNNNCWSSFRYLKKWSANLLFILQKRQSICTTELIHVFKSRQLMNLSEHLKVKTNIRNFNRSVLVSNFSMKLWLTVWGKVCNSSNYALLKQNSEI